MGAYCYTGTFSPYTFVTHAQMNAFKNGRHSSIVVEKVYECRRISYHHTYLILSTCMDYSPLTGRAERVSLFTRLCEQVVEGNCRCD